MKEVIKVTVRYAILWLPVILEVLNGINTGGISVGVSIMLTAIDKALHESSVPVKGIVPF